MIFCFTFRGCSDTELTIYSNASSSRSFSKKWTRIKRIEQLINFLYFYLYIVNSILRCRTINVAGAEITIDAEQKVTIKAGSEIKIEAPKITVDAQQELTAKGGMKATVSGMNLELKGDTAAKMSGGATAEVSGGATTTIKGGIVMIN